eukprot:Plantae.Rhodophyta-Purpureofilum_apyrenoidigerum.ctg3346.p2 GENE.Plantae.Rhodophyta-Purpureofilum_apyrenoidigerum.ctg3346~~Plantae.Rhodophyta-Purpureofilum_apyrenoidigerum.ctg3346.p2  ORF type:complete len:260 (-),score=38.08 Plantae.Rhodophyta-Purpureofilum_apyrenoidigerum.ctg3346:889-1668(-)
MIGRHCVVLRVLVFLVCLTVVRSELRGGSGEFFDTIASTYDLLNRIISLGFDKSWRRTAVEHLRIDDGVVLDVSTGTADVAMLVAEMRPRVFVHGIDPSQNMVNLGKKKIRENNLAEKIKLIIGVVEDMSVYKDASFDGVIVSFGIRNFQDREKGLMEIARVLKPGKRLVILELDGEDPDVGPVLQTLRQKFIGNFMPFIGGLISGKPDTYRYLHKSSQNFPSPRQFRQLLRQCGFSTVWDTSLPPFSLGPRLTVASRT